MHRPTPLIALLVALTAALAGCAGNGDESDTDPTPSTNTTTPTTSATPTPTSTLPSVTPPVNVTPPVSVTPPVGGATNVTNASVDRVYVISAPERAGNGTNADVCWRVEGNGTITHTALHWDTASHPDGSFSAYPNAVYPNNGAPVGQHKLPGAFCATIGPVNATIYFKAHAMSAPTDSELSVEETIIAGSGANQADVVGAPDVFPAGLSTNLCWGLGGVTAPTAGRLLWSTTPMMNATAADYTQSVPANGTADASGNYCAAVTMPANGTLYVRAAVTNNGTETLGVERSIVAAPRVAISGGLPRTAAAGSTLQVCWRAEGSSGATASTSLLWDTTSHASAVSTADYPNNVTATSGTAHPGPFCANVTMPASGTLYLRPQARYPAPGGVELGPEYAVRVA